MQSNSMYIRIFYTILLYFNNFAFGVGINMYSASLVDLSYIYSTTIDTMSYANVCILVGYFSGSFANYLYKWLNRQITLAILVLLLALFGGLPFAGHLYVGFTMVCLGGVGAGAWDSAQSLWLVELWPEKNTALLIGLQLMYGIGAIVAPLIVAPFVYGKMNVTADGEVITIEHRIHSLTMPYLATGVVLAIVPILFLIMYFLCPFEKQQFEKSLTTDETTKEIETPTSSPKIDLSAIPYRTAKLTLVSICVATYIAGEGNFLSFSTSMYQYLEIHLSASEAARVQSVLSGTFTLGRLIAALVSLRVPIDIMLTVHYGIQVVGILTVYFGRNSLTVIYIGTATLGIGFSCIWPGMFAYCERFLVLTDRICSLFVCLSGTVGQITPLVLSQSFKQHPLVLMYLTGMYIVISFSLFIAVRFWIARQPNAMSFKDDDGAKVVKKVMI